jgi:glutaminyl-peptide cyclotransferase
MLKEPKTMNWKALCGLGIVGCVLVATVATFAFPKDDTPAVKPLKLVASFNHDAQAFSQGLVIRDGEMFEGTGQYGSSTLRRVDLESGKVLASVPLRNEFFGEGITLLGDTIYQLTWKENVCFAYDRKTLKQIGSFRFSDEGWGLTNDGKELYLSDGTSNIRVLDPKTFKVTRRLRVHVGARKIDKLNELEFVNGEILANIWYSDHIARISPKNGAILGWLDASHLYPADKRPSREHVLNGIAYDTQSKRLFITGKNWPQLFEVALPD